MSGESDEARGNRLAQRAWAYGQTAVEGVRLASWDVVDALSDFRKATEELAGKTDGMTPRELVEHAFGLADRLAERLKPLAEHDVKDMEAIAHLVARAFVIGWEARGDEPGRPARALGGAAERRRRPK